MEFMCTYQRGLYIISTKTHKDLSGSNQDAMQCRAVCYLYVVCCYYHVSRYRNTAYHTKFRADKDVCLDEELFFPPKKKILEKYAFNHLPAYTKKTDF